MRVRLSIVVALVLASGLLLAGARPVGAQQQCFPQTGHCVEGRFLDYWVAHGGLAVNGYPLTDEVRQQLEDGNTYTVQYFERVRLEYHPENQPPYDVELGQFGRLLHPADPPATAQPGMVFFAVTGHNVPPDFAAYWQASGGLDQFGYPLSEVVGEQLEDGHTYQVQYFERARFERHPENQPPYTVELGQFGRRILASLPPGSLPPAPPPPAPSPSPSPSPSPAPQATYQLTASVSDATPAQYHNETVYATLTNNGQGVAGATMTTTWHYKTTTSSCSGGPSGDDGVMSCTREISRATIGYTVAIDVTVTYQGQTYTATTSFTPR